MILTVCRALELQDETDTGLGLLDLTVSGQGSHWTPTPISTSIVTYGKCFERKRWRRAGASREGLYEEVRRSNGEGQRKAADQGSWFSFQSTLDTSPVVFSSDKKGNPLPSFNFL